MTCMCGTAEVEQLRARVAELEQEVEGLTVLHGRLTAAVLGTCESCETRPATHVVELGAPYSKPFPVCQECAA